MAEGNLDEIKVSVLPACKCYTKHAVSFLGKRILLHHWKEMTLLTFAYDTVLS